MFAVVEVLAAWGWSSGSDTSALACISPPIREVGLGTGALALVPEMLGFLGKTLGSKLNVIPGEGRGGEEGRGGGRGGEGRGENNYKSHAYIYM